MKRTPRTPDPRLPAAGDRLPASRPATGYGLPPVVVTAAIIATIAFGAYTRTLLPGVDLGDSGGFQAAVLWPDTSARQAYPLYYALARPFVGLLSADNPARGLNLFSAVWGAIAVGLLTGIAAFVTRSLVAGAAGGLLLAFSLTFWSQAIIAEVYTLHLALMGACIVALLALAARPSRPRLAIAMALYALAFGNHLHTIVLLPAFAIYVAQVYPDRRALLSPSTIAMGAAIAFLCALQYLPNLLAVWRAFDAPASPLDRLAAFWFDTTKSDWRESMVLGVDGSRALDRMAMWVWDGRLQFGVAGLTVAVIGAIRLWRLSVPFASLTLVAWASSTLFALTYNVGDAHVFFLPAHYFAAFACAAAVAPFGGSREQDGGSTRQDPPYAVAYVGRVLWTRRLIALLLIGYAVWRGWDTSPAVSRADDRRSATLVRQLAGGLSADDAVLLTQLNWQVENALLYSGRVERPDLAWSRLAEVLPEFPLFVRDKHGIGRDVVLTASGAAAVLAAYGPLFTLVPEQDPESASLAALAGGLPAGTPYVLSLITPPADERLDAADFAAALQRLGGPSARPAGGEAIQIWAGITGERPSYTRASERPFDDRMSLLGDDFRLRVDGWLPFDTFRRGGFGHILRGRERVLIVERGVSLVWFSPSGRPSTAYMAGLYAPGPRFRIPARVDRLALARPLEGLSAQ